MTALHEAFRARLAKLVADGRALNDAHAEAHAEDLGATDLADYVEDNADTIVTAAVDNLTSVVDVIVPESLRPAVLRRLAERVDLLPWTMPPVETSTPLEDPVPGSDRDIVKETTLIAEAMGEEARTLHRLYGAIELSRATDQWRHLVDDDQFFMTRHLFSHGWFGARIDAQIPPDRENDVDGIIDRIAEKNWRLGLLWTEKGWIDIHTARLVAWFFVDETSPDRLARTAAETVLSEARGKGDDLAMHPEALRELSRRVEDVSPRAPAPDLVAAADVVEGVHPLDEALAAMVEGFGQTGRKLAENIRDTTKKKPEERAARWRPLVDPLRVPRLIAKALWDDVVKPQLERAASRIDAPGLSLPVLTNLVRVSRSGAQPTMFDDGRADILDHRGRRVGSLQLTPTIGSDHINLANLGKLSTTRLVRHLLHRTWEQKWIHGLPEADRIDVDGGFPGLAKVLGMKAHKAPEELREAVATLAALRIDSPTGEGQVFAYWHSKATGQRPARLEMHVMGPFAPDYIARSLAGHRRSAQDKYLVPVPLPQRLPPLVGRERDHAAQAFLQVLVLRELRVRAEELREVGSVEIGERQWEALRDEAGVPKATMRDVLAAYPIGNADQPAFLLSPTQGRYALADAYDQERRSILEAAEAMANGRAGGKAAAASRRRGGRKARAPK